MDMCSLGCWSCSVDPLESKDLWRPNNSDDYMCQMEGDGFTKFNSVKLGADRPEQKDNKFSFHCGALLSEDDDDDDDELTESKIRAFLDEKALELKKLQTPLYEEFYSSLNSTCSPNFVGSSKVETSPNYLKLPPKSRLNLIYKLPRITSSSPSVSSSEIKKKWKEELDQELERKREMMRQAGVGGKISSPKDRALSRQREKTRFASPSK